MDNDLSKLYRTFSGTDSLAFMILPYTVPILLGSLTTISHSMFRDKKPVPLIGKINVGGFTRGTRIYAGTMIFTMINQHWVNELIDQVPWLGVYEKLKADELPLFDIMIISANEYGSSVQMFIDGVDITDEGQVLSVEDLFTENQFSFVARDIQSFSNDNTPKFKYNASNTISSVNSFDIEYGYKEASSFLSTRIPLDRNLSYSSANMLTGDDVLQVQTLLNSFDKTTQLSGVFDSNTLKAVQTYQASVGLPITGSVTDDTWKALNSSVVPTNSTAMVLSKEGTIIYKSPSTSSDIIDKLNYKDNVDILVETTDWYKISKGYVLKSQMFSSKNTSSDEFSTLRLNSKESNVIILQNSLNTFLNKKIPISGSIDKETEDSIKEFESKVGLTVDGIIDKNDWIVLQERVNNSLPVNSKSDIYTLELISIPKTAKYNLENFKFNNEGIKCKDIKGDASVKISAIAYYDNKKSKIYSTIVNLTKGEVDTCINPSLLQDAFLYNSTFKELPKSVEVIILPSGNEPLKWIYNF